MGQMRPPTAVLPAAPSLAAQQGGIVRAFGLCLELSKARLASLVIATTVVGYLVAGGRSISLLLWTTAGTALAALGANAFNQWIEEERDRRMLRTRGRPLPSGRLSRRLAVVWAGGAVLGGLAILAWQVNPLTTGLALLIEVLYLFVYTPLKTKTPLCTLVGAVCGAVPPLMGWAAVRGALEPGAWILGLLLFTWQIPHFLALAWLHREDYERGGFRMLPAIDRSGEITGLLVVLHILALLPLGPALGLAGLVGPIGVTGSLVLGCGFLFFGLRLSRQRTDRNARAVFYASLIYLPLLLMLMVLDRGPFTQTTMQPRGARLPHEVAARVADAGSAQLW